MRTSARSLTFAVALSLAIAGCASVPRDPAAQAEFRANHDPLEPFNRKIFAFNQVMDRILIKPIAKGYRRVLPEQAREVIRNFLDNLHEPVIFANSLLQTRFRSAGTTGLRFLLNSIAGPGGLSDVATEMGLKKQSGDFGQTLAVWGASEGPYLIVPVFGPTNPRDGIGMGADIYLDPVRTLLRGQSSATDITVSRSFVDGIDQRARSIEPLDEIQHESIDYYASFRSFFRQHRAAELKTGAAMPTPAQTPTDFYLDPGR